MRKLELKCTRCGRALQITRGPGDDLNQSAGWRYEPVTFLCPCCGLSGKSVPSVRMAIQLQTMKTKEEWDTYERTRQKAFRWLAKGLRKSMIHYYDYGNQKYWEELEKDVRNMDEELYTQVLQCGNELRLAAEKDYMPDKEEAKHYGIYYDSHRIRSLLDMLVREYDDKIDNSAWLEVLDVPEIRVYNEELLARQAAKRTQKAWIRLEKQKSICPRCGKELKGTERSDPDLKFCPACGAKLNR